MRHDAGVTSGTSSRLQRGLVVLGIVVLAFNLRPAAVSVGPVLGEVSTGLGMTTTETGVLTSLPVLAFALFGALAPRLARAVGLHRLTLAALLCLVGGLAGRAAVSSVPAFLALSLLALAGMASANVLLPSLVKLHFPNRIGLLTSLYSTALAVGLTSASVLTVPVSEAYDGWRSGLLVWALIAGIAVIPWLGLIGHDRRPEEVAGHVGLGDVARTRLGWLMALFFGLQALQAYSIFGWFAELYQDAGFSAPAAGLLLGVITGVSIPLSFLIPWLVARTHDQRLVMCVVMGCYPLGYLGLMVAPARRCAGVGGAGRHRDRDLPDDPHADRPAGPHPGRHGGAVRVRPVDRLPDRRHRPLRHRAAPRRLGRMDGASDRPAHRHRAPVPARAGGLAPGVRRGRAQRAPAGRSLRP